MDENEPGEEPSLISQFVAWAAVAIVLAIVVFGLYVVAWLLRAERKV